MIHLRLVFIGLVALVALFAGPVPVAHGSTFIVNNVGDGPDSDTGDGICNDGSGNCTLRAAIQQANALGGANEIIFSSASLGLISLGSALPDITTALTISGAGGCGTPRCTTVDGALIAGPADGFKITGTGGATIRRLVITSFDGAGIKIDTAGGNTITGNLIGVSSFGCCAVPNTGSGVLISNSANNQIGGSTEDERNLISGNGADGVRIFGASSTNNKVEGNRIGVKWATDADLGNTLAGVQITAAGGNTIGDPLLASKGNVIGFNDGSGVAISGGANGNVVQSNSIISNGLDGVTITDSSNNTIVDGTNDEIKNNTRDGIRIKSGTGNTIGKAQIYDNGALGIDLDGDGVTPNDPGDGDGGPNGLQNYPVLTSIVTTNTTTTITGSFSGAPFTTYAFQGYFSLPSTCDPSGHGEGFLPYSGVENLPTDGGGGLAGSLLFDFPTIAGSLLTVTATDPSGNTSEFSNCTQITGPIVVNSIIDFPDNNPGDGICSTFFILTCSLRAAIEEANALGGIQTIEFNIAGAGPHVINLTMALPLITDSLTIDGTSEPDYAGTPVIELNGAGAGAGADGLSVGAVGNVFLKGLMINHFDGAGIDSGGTTDIRSNYIGTEATGTVDRGNGGAGIDIGCGGGIIYVGGGGGLANIIAFNEGDGVQIAQCATVEIVENSIYSNDGLGIDLVGGTEDGSGITANDDLDPDAGLQNYPVLFSATSHPGGVRVLGTINTTPSTAGQIKFYVSDVCDPSGYGEGKTYLSPVAATTNSLGDAPFTFVQATPVAAGKFITAIARFGLATSEFSECFEVFLDSDQDGVEDGVDPAPTTSGTTFLDDDPGTTSGSFTVPVGTFVAVTDEPDDSVVLENRGVLIRLGGIVAGAGAVICPTAIGMVIPSERIFTCGSVHVGVGTGLVTSVLDTIPVSIPSGAGATLDETAPGVFEISNHSGSNGPVTVGGLSLDPGETATVQDSDGDGQVDEVDPNDDDDGYWDDDEAAKGSDQLDDTSTPEHCDGVDNDGDTTLDEAPAGSGRSTPDPLCDPDADPDGDTIPNSADLDDDDDGWSDVDEQFLSTDELDDCSNNTAHDAEAPDFDKNTKKNIIDVLFFGAVLFKDYNRRFDLNTNGTINIIDVLMFGAVIGQDCDGP